MSDDDEQGDIFNWKPPVPEFKEPLAHKGVETSQLAAERIRPLSGGMQRRILNYILHRGEAMYDEVVVDLRMEKPTVAGRLNDLKRGGFIVDSGRKRPTRSGSPATVYVATDLGRRA